MVPRASSSFQAASIEAEEEAGVLGPVTLDPVGTYEYQSNRKAAGDLIRVDVYRLDVKRRVPEFKEEGRRRLVWLTIEEAASRVSEPGLVPIIEALNAPAQGGDA